MGAAADTLADMGVNTRMGAAADMGVNTGMGAAAGMGVNTRMGAAASMDASTGTGANTLAGMGANTGMGENTTVLEKTNGAQTPFIRVAEVLEPILRTAVSFLHSVVFRQFLAVKSSF
jgi:hypothetical protein